MSNEKTTHQKRFEHLPKELYKFVNGLSPLIINNFFLFSKIFSLNISTIRKLQPGTESITCSGPQTWNLIPENIRNASSFHIFFSKN